MPTDRELLQQALAALETVIADVKSTPTAYEAQRQATAALRARLAQPEPEPVAWMYDFPNPDHSIDLVSDWIAHDYEEVVRNNGVNVRPLYLHPQCKWISLTDEEIRNAFAPVVKQHFNPQHGAHSFDVLGVGGASMVLHLSRAIEAQLKQKNHSGDCAEMVKKEWHGLSTAETKVLWNLTKKPREYAQMIEAKLREYNG